MPTTLWITVENGFATLSFHDKFEIDLGRITPHSVGSAGTSRNRERLSEVAPAGSVNVGVDVPPELLVMAGVVRPQLNSMLSGRPVIIPVVSRVSVVQVEVMA